MKMFEQTFVATGKTHNTTTVLVSFVVQSILVIVGILIPMIYFDALPAAQLKSLLVAPPPPTPPPPPPPELPKLVKIIPRPFDAGRLITPREVPKNIALIKEDELPPPSPDGGVRGLAGGANSGVPFGILGPVRTAAPPPPPLVEKKAPPRIQVGGIVQSAKLLRQPKPVYPELARKARIQGVVKLHALISKGGAIEDLKVVSGHPLLVPSALEAVKQ